MTALLGVGMLFCSTPAFSQTGGGTQSGNDQRSQPRSGGLTQFDFSVGIGSFYYIDEFGLNVSLPQLIQEGVIDPATYRLGPGDMLTIDFTGEFSGIMKGLLVNPNGYLAIPRIGTIDVNDLLLEDAQEAVEAFVQSKYRGTEVSLAVDRPRMLKVHVAGDVPFPGIHVIRPQTRLDQAVFTAFFEIPAFREQPGVNPFPDFPFRYPSNFMSTSGFATRNIEIERKDGSVVSADLMDYFHGGNLEANPIVKEGDIIHIRTIDEFAPGLSISGGVKTNRQLEYREDDTLETIIRIAGGFSADANKAEITVFRNTMNGVRTLTFDGNSSDDMQTELLPNDRIVIPFDLDARQNFIATINGEVNLPGSFPIEDGETTVYDLLQLAGGLSERALPSAAYMLRTRPARSEFGNRPPFDPERILRTSDQLAQGFEYLALESELNRNEVYINLTDEDQMRSVKLFTGDRIFVPRDDNTIFMLGQIRQPGYYPFDSGRSVDDYISQAGGFTIPAEQERVFVIKAGSETWYKPSETTLESGDVIFVDRVPFDDLVAQRTYDIQQRQIRNSNIQLIMTGITTITGIITTYVAITR